MDPQVENTPEKKSFFSYVNPQSNFKGFAFFVIAAVIGIGSLSLGAVSFTSQRQKATQNAPKSDFKSLSNHSVVYGYWEGDKSHIKAVNLSDGSIYNLADLGANIKKVTIQSPTKFIFINKTDVRDHGQEIATYDSETKTTDLWFAADPEFGIDDYVVSPNKNFIAIWEVSVPEGKGLNEGRSRVYTATFQNPQTKHLIYDEALQTTTTAHYPVAITDTGEVFMDRFQPNSGDGWANGMSYSDFNGSTKQDIPSMTAGSYGTQPQASPDGKSIAFAGYDGSSGNGNLRSTMNFRNAVLSPNTIGILDTATKQVRLVKNPVSKTIYPSVGWDETTGKILYSQISEDANLSGQYLYSLASQVPEKVEATTQEGHISSYSFITSLENEKFLTGQRSLSDSSLGNLGPAYMQPLSEIGVYNNSDKSLAPVSVGMSLIQYIGVVPASYFSSNLKGGQVGGKGRETTDQLQLQTFTIKPTLRPTRETQQTDPPRRDLPFCDNWAVAQCNKLNGTNYTIADTRNPYSQEDVAAGKDPEGQKFKLCFFEQMRNPPRGELCVGSPLYLYGPEGKNVTVKIGTKISNSNAPYENGFNGILSGSGGITIGGKRYLSLDYDYSAAVRKLPLLSYGKTVKSEDVGKAIVDYGEKLGLTQKEIDDTIKDIGSIDLPYVFVSFYDDATSKAILPISFEPEPDVYRNIVFYLKKVSAPIVAEKPKFAEVPQRQGFTAVEVSYIVVN